MGLPTIPLASPECAALLPEWLERVRAAVQGLDWSSPRVLGALVVLAILALVRRWSLVLLVVLVVALAKGLEYLMVGAGMDHGFIHGVVIGVYVFGAVLFFFMAVAHFFTRE
jgi:hypothetical protein